MKRSLDLTRQATATAVVHGRLRLHEHRARQRGHIGGRAEGRDSRDHAEHRADERHHRSGKARVGGDPGALGLPHRVGALGQAVARQDHGSGGPCEIVGGAAPVGLHARLISEGSAVHLAVLVVQGLRLGVGLLPLGRSGSEGFRLAGSGGRGGPALARSHSGGDLLLVVDMATADVPKP